MRAWMAKRGCGSGTETGLDRASTRGDDDGAEPARFRKFLRFSHSAVRRSCCGRLGCCGECGQSFQPLDVPDEAEHLRHELGFEPRRSPDVAVPRGAIPGCAVVKADVPPCAMGDSLLTGSNEIGLAFGEALAPDGDGFAKPIAVERRRACRGRRLGLETSVGNATGGPPPGVTWVMAGFPCWRGSPGPLKRAGAGASLRGGGQLVLVGVGPRTRVGAVLGVLVAVPGALPFPGASVVLRRRPRPSSWRGAGPRRSRPGWVRTGRSGGRRCRP